MKSKIKQFIGFGICSVVALAVCLAVLVVTVNNLDKEQATSQPPMIESLTKLDNSKETLKHYFNTVISNTEDRFVKTKTYTNISISELVVSGGSSNKEQDIALFDFVVKQIQPMLDSYYTEDFEGTFAKDDSYKPNLRFNDGVMAKAAYSVGQVDENGESVLDDEGNVVDAEYYYLTFVIDGKTISDNEELSIMFSSENDINAKNLFIEASEDSISINKFNSEPVDFTVEAKINRETDKLEYIDVIRNYKITLDVSFINKTDFLGSKELTFVYSVRDTYEYFYAGVSFGEDEITIGMNEEYMLDVNAVIDDDSEYKVEFSSSDGKIVSVDEMGYVKGVKNSDTPVIITVKLNYLDKIFTDTCAVNVNRE